MVTGTNADSNSLAQEELRFGFGENWARFLELLSPERIEEAENSLRTLLDVEDLTGTTFLDVGSGSGLFSLVARRLGARVFSFDYDQNSVNCTLELKRRYFENDDQWEIERGSVLDREYLARLGKFDFVYSWGVLHHTGNMWEAMQNITETVHSSGVLAIALYNDQGGASKRWLEIKKFYNRLPSLLKPIFSLAFLGFRDLRFILIDIVRGNPLARLEYIRNYSRYSSRGMSYWHDFVDWIGGYPFEVASPEDVFSFYSQRNFTLTNMTTVAGTLGCNQFVFLNEKLQTELDRI